MSRELGAGDLVLCAGTVAQGDFASKAAAAAAGGFRGLSFFLADYQNARAAGHGDAELRRMLDDHGLAVAEMDVLLSWVPGSTQRDDGPPDDAAIGGGSEDDFFRAAAALRARSINAAALVDTSADLDAIADAFAALCERAAEHELLVHLEFLPFTPIRNVDVALSLVERAGPNGGVMLDTWHHFRGDTQDARLRDLPGARILGVQLNDAPRQAAPNPIEETMHARLLPGDGDIDLPGVISALRAIGSPAPFGVEVFSDELLTLPVEEAGRRAGAAARAVLTKTGAE
jgi:sugar phosphate isomerase/epimerase